MDMETQPIELAKFQRGVQRIKPMLQHMLGNYRRGQAVRLWNGEILQLGMGTPEATRLFHYPCPLRELVLFRDPLRLAFPLSPQGVAMLRETLEAMMGIKSLAGDS